MGMAMARWLEGTTTMSNGDGESEDATVVVSPVAMGGGPLLSSPTSSPLPPEEPGLGMRMLALPRRRAAGTGSETGERGRYRCRVTRRHGRRSSCSCVVIVAAESPVVGRRPLVAASARQASFLPTG
ncbi:Os01g0878200 [Oryza sativa Japonica Group]|uniref:Os01g0878200 protein n=3 Tax=Oryza sativa subsp. japonica TaxID=39947 RepID=C7IXH0_ORYSJ|nr:hypothetical protein EE612_007154 [Oryza sativa]BAH91403.1 Os01g0878100 [Oryza sativa Japonica Group]BAS75526.1 Os01g0878200 [Oryza sativa Japonica Group]|eukprot:NP_001172673.1 Os01g0878100 [Oryza sativa Japonica Group]